MRIALCLAVLACPIFVRAPEGKTREPAVSLVLGGTRIIPFGPANAREDYGTRVGLAFASALQAGELRLPMEWGLSLRTTSIGFSGWFNHDVFTDLQIPVIFHGALPWWNRLELLALWTPSYTLDMVSTSSFAGNVSGIRSLRTRYNMGFGGGMQLSFLGAGLRACWVYNLFAPLPATRLTFADLSLEATVPFVWKRVVP